MSLYPERPIYSPWSDVGTALTQGAGIVNQLDQSRNALQALVEKRALAEMERQRQARDDAMTEWKNKKIIQDQADEDAARSAVFDARANGISAPGPDVTLPVTPLNRAWGTSGLSGAAPVIPSPDLANPVKTAPGSNVMRPATAQDIKDIAFKFGQLTAKDYTAQTPFEESRDKAAGTIAGYTANNHSDFMGSAAKYVSDKLAAEPTKPPSMAEVDAAAAVADPTGNRFSDRAYQAYIKSFDKAAAAQNSNTGVINAGTKKDQLGINQQNADTAAKRAADEAAKTALRPGTTMGDREAEQRTKWEQKLQGNYEKAVTSSRGGVNLQAASNAFETINKTLASKTLSASDVTAVKDQVAKLLNPGFAISKVQFAHLNNGGLMDDISNWTSHLGGGNVMLTSHQKQQYQTLVDRLAEELKSAHKSILKDYGTQAHKISTQRGWAGQDSISMTPKDFSFDMESADASMPSALGGLGLTAPAAPIAGARVWARDPSTGKLVPQ